MGLPTPKDAVFPPVLTYPERQCTCRLTSDLRSAATNESTGEGVAIKKVTNVFSKKILAKRALREIKLLQHFRGHRNVGLALYTLSTQII